MKKYTIALIWLTVLLLSLILLYSCSANYHFNKFIKKGGTIDTTERIVTIEKTIKVNGKDSIILIEVPVKCPEVQIPPTRQEVRYKYKLQRDSIKTYRYAVKWKTKEVVKVAKSENKKPFNWFWIGLGIGFVSAVVIRLIWKRL